MERKKVVRKYSIFAILIAFWFIFRYFPTFTEWFYSEGIYPFTATFSLWMGTLFYG